MSTKTMTRTAADNKYLHRDFHVSADLGIAYVGERYGDNGVKAYLRRYASSYLGPLSERVRAEGLAALERYFHELYAAEEAEEVLSTELSGGELSVRVERCPAVAFMKSTGHTPCRWYRETVATVYETVADNAGIGFELLSYDPADGRCALRFFAW